MISILILPWKKRRMLAKNLAFIFLISAYPLEYVAKGYWNRNKANTSSQKNPDMSWYIEQCFKFDSITMENETVSFWKFGGMLKVPYLVSIWISIRRIAPQPTKESRYHDTIVFPPLCSHDVDCESRTFVLFFEHPMSMWVTSFPFPLAIWILIAN